MQYEPTPVPTPNVDGLEDNERPLDMERQDNPAENRSAGQLHKAEGNGQLHKAEGNGQLHKARGNRQPHNPGETDSCIKLRATNCV